MRFSPAVSALSLAAIAAIAALGLGLRAAGADAANHAPATKGAAAKGSAALATTTSGSGMYSGDCAGACFSIYSRRFGTGMTMNAHIPGDAGTGGTVGRRVDLHPAGNGRPNEEFLPKAIGQVAQFCGTDPNDFFAPASYACQHYQAYWLFEAQWSPFGNESGLCAGVASAGLSGENVTLRPCGVSARTLWIGDRANGTGGDCRYPGNYCPWISATGVDGIHSLALTVDDTSALPVLDQLKAKPLQLTGTVASNGQEFAYFWGPVV